MCVCVCVSLSRRHFVGYATIKFNLLPRSTIEGLGAYVATIGLPSLLFDSIARLSFDNVDWHLVTSVLIAKMALVVLSIALAWLTTRRADGTGFAFTLGGVISLLSTMSDDIGIGLPVFSAFIEDDGTLRAATAHHQEPAHAAPIACVPPPRIELASRFRITSAHVRLPCLFAPCACMQLRARHRSCT